MTTPEPDFRYWAFISYSSMDKSWARWLHRAIETYGVPTKLISHVTPAGHPAPKRFHPLFRDATELPASADLGEQITAALRASRFLIVVCSRNAARSRWVNKEIETFQGLDRHGRILAVIVDGEPNTGDERECFPPALRQCEPLAADVRPDRGGKRDAKLRLIAGMLGVGFDALSQRDLHRRMRRLQMGIAAALLAVLAFAGMAWYSNQQRIKAVTARNQAESILEYLLYDLRDMLAPVGRLDIVADVQKRVDTYYKELGVDPSDPRLQRNRGSASTNEGNRLLAQGDLTAALKSYQESLTVAERLAAADPSDDAKQYELASTQAKVGDVLRAKGDLDGALKVYRDALGILQRHAAANSSSLRWQRDLRVIQTRIGDITLLRGDLVGALTSYREMLAASQVFLANFPSDTGVQHDIAASHISIGDVLRAQGKPKEALAEYREGQSGAKRLAAADPSDTSRQRELAASCSKVGDVLKDLGDLTAALDAFLDGRDVMERLATADPSNVKWQRDYRTILVSLGDVFFAGGELARALTSYRQAETGFRRLAAAEPANTGSQRDLSFACEGVGNVLREQGDIPGALSAYRESLRLRQALTAADPSNTRWQRDLAAAQLFVATMLDAQGDASGALAAANEMLSIARRLAALDPSNADWLRNLAVSYAKMGQLSERANPRRAVEWWGNAYDQLAGMKQRGIMAASDEGFLETVRKKAGR